MASEPVPIRAAGAPRPALHPHGHRRSRFPSQRPTSVPVIWPGQPYPLGATYDGLGTNFSVFSETAERVELCLFDEAGNETRLDLPEMTAFCWHGYVPSILPGTRYGFRVYGRRDTRAGRRFNPKKLLLDPYAKAVEGGVRWGQAVYGYTFGDPDGPPNPLDSSPYMPKSVVVNPYFDWTSDHAPRRPQHETVIYEVHVKGFSELNREIPPPMRGTYAGLAHPASIRYLQTLGVTAVELLPVHQFVDDALLVENGLSNYWGYNSIAFFAPHNEYSSTGQRGEQVTEFKGMVKALHAAGIEVILDVVYNHTAEGNHLGPELSLKGIDNEAYYRLVHNDKRYYMDYTGTGNTLNVRNPQVLQLIMDSLRYWVTEMHVDGFRFDLAAALARELHEVDRLSAFFDLIHQDPVISQVKLIAEPWDVGEGGYQVGNFPTLWSEWNGRYRDTIRDFWRGVPHVLGDFANRLTGSSDLYETTGRRPSASINFVTAHDGFTLRDLVSYNSKHNEANLEDNADGTNDNRSWNCGVEGPTDDPAVLELRARQQRNFLATLFLSQGVPMLLGGDEIGRTQEGNNNAYCQDNEISWYDWADADAEMLQFTSQLIEFRRDHPVFRRRRWFQGRPIRGEGIADLEWFRTDGSPMGDEDWNDGRGNVIGVYLRGDVPLHVDMRGEPVIDDTFFLVVNATHLDVAFCLPPADRGREWKVVIDTCDANGFPADGPTYEASTELTSHDRSLLVLRRVA